MAKRKPHLRGLRMSKPYSAYDGRVLRSVCNSSGTTLFLVVEHEGQFRNAENLIEFANTITRDDADRRRDGN